MAGTRAPANVGQPTVLSASWRLHLEAANLSPRTVRGYTDDGAPFAAFLVEKGMPTAVVGIEREHVEAFIAAELERTSASSAATRYRSLQQFFRWLDEEGEIDGSPMAKMRKPLIPEQPVPVLPDADIKRLLDSCAGRDFRKRRDSAIIRPFLDTGMRLEGMTGLRYDASEPDLSDVDLHGNVVRIIAKGRREMVLPIGKKTARDIDRYLRVCAAHPRADDAWLWLGKKGRLTASGIYQMIKDRGNAVGLPDLHPHQLRHTFSHDWARQRRFRRGPHAPGRLEVPRDAQPLRGERGRRARPRRPPPPIPWRQVLEISQLHSIGWRLVRFPPRSPGPTPIRYKFKLASSLKSAEYILHRTL